jgi:hypothetical protein
VRGYTASANDGGKGEIDCNGVTMFASNYAINLVDLKCHNFGNNNGITVAGGNNSSVIMCEVYKGASSPSGKTLVNFSSSNGRIVGCYVHDAGTTGIGIAANYAQVYGNYVYNCPTGISCQAGSNAVENIIVDCTTNGITTSSSSEPGLIVHNSIYSSTAATGSGISSAHSGWVIMNNVVEGYSGSGGCGLKTTTNEVSIVGYNSYYNCATNESLADVTTNLSGLVSLSASPFVSASGGNFALSTGVTGAIENSFPGAWYGPASTTSKADRGAVQNGAGSSGGMTNSQQAIIGRGIISH